MKHTLLKLLWITVIILTAVSASAQQSKQDMLRRRAAEKVGQMCDYIEFMANPQNNFKTRNYYRTMALNLFINKGEPYEEDGRKKKGVLMEVTSVNNKTSRHRLIKEYFTGLINLNYEKVTISTTEVSDIEVSKLKRIAENQYVCTCYFEQVFCGYREGRPVYRDVTRKKVKCYVFKEQTEDGEEYMVMLGDVTAMSTKRF